MPRNLIVDPTTVRSRSVIEIPDIPVNAYESDFKKELKTHGKQGLIDILHDMIAIRSFETMLNSIKTTGGWNGIEYNHRGPAHLSIGQESAVVGEMLREIAGAHDVVDFEEEAHAERAGYQPPPGTWPVRSTSVCRAGSPSTRARWPARMTRSS